MVNPMKPSSLFVLRKIQITTLAAFALLLAGAVSAAPIHHVHLNVTEPEEAARWHARMFGGRYERVADKFDGAVFSNPVIQLLFNKSDGRLRPGALAWIGYEVKDILAAEDRISDAGARVIKSGRAGDSMFLRAEDPWGVPLLLLENPSLEGFHHVGVAPGGAGAAEALGWLSRTFGGREASYLGQFDLADFGNALILGNGGPAAVAPGGTGLLIDHVCWTFDDLDAAVEKFKAMPGVRLIEEIHPVGPSRKAVIESPQGIRIELLQTPPQQ